MHIRKSTVRDRTPKSNTDTATTPTTESQLLAREVRQDLFRKIQACTDRPLLCYVGRYEISEDDVRHLQELLNTVESMKPLDLLLNSPGGDIRTADKLVRMLSGASSEPESAPSGEFRVIVPDQAKSAATLMALGASEIVMSTSSELGPIDPQVELQDQDGNWNWHSAFDYVETYKEAENNFRKKPDDPVFGAVFDKLDSVRFRGMEKLIEYTRKCAENILMRTGGSYTLTPSRLMNRERFPVHAQVVDWEDARHYLHLNVNFLDHSDELWKLYWRLYVHLQSALLGRQKIFESADVSMIVE